jgi:hypothetical protein
MQRSSASALEHVGGDLRCCIMKRPQHKRRSASHAYKTGSRVKWTGDLKSGGANTAEGVVRKSFTHRIERTIKGATVTREADARNPAYLIEQDDGDKILKSHSELTRVQGADVS